MKIWSFPDSSVIKEFACNAGDLRSIPGLGRSPGEGKGYPLRYSGLENSMDCIVHGVPKNWAWLRNFHFHFTFQKQYLMRSPKDPCKRRHSWSSHASHWFLNVSVLGTKITASTSYTFFSSLFLHYLSRNKITLLTDTNFTVDIYQGPILCAVV